MLPSTYLSTLLLIKVVSILLKLYLRRVENKPITAFLNIIFSSAQHWFIPKIFWASLLQNLYINSKPSYQPLASKGRKYNNFLAFFDHSPNSYIDAITKWQCHLWRQLDLVRRKAFVEGGFRKSVVLLRTAVFNTIFHCS